jgi:leucyl-tRNA synthetase
LCEAGDGLEDGNLLEKTADDAILILFNELEWIKDNFASSSSLRCGELSWNDMVFMDEIDSIVMEAEKAYDNMLYREVYKLCFHSLSKGFIFITLARDEYRKATTGQGLPIKDEIFEGMHRELLIRFVEVQALVLSPITPHWSDHLWRNILRKVV